MPSKNANREYMVLNEVLPGERGRNLLGSVIYAKHHTHPDDNYVPHRPALNDEGRKQVANLFEGVWSNPAAHVRLEDLIKEKSETHSGRTSLKIFEIFNAWITRNKGRSSTVTAGDTRRYTIPNVGQELRSSFMKCEPWWTQVQTLYEDAYLDDSVVLYLITGVWLCSEMVIHTNTSNLAGGGGAANFAAGQQAPPVEGRIEMKRERREEDGVKIPEEVVFAIKCHRLELKEETKSPGNGAWWWWWFNRSTPSRKTLTGLSLGLPVPGNTSAFAGDVSEESDDDLSPELACFYVSEPAFAEIRDVEETLASTDSNGSAW